MGPRGGHDKAIRILNRVIDWGTNGIEYEGDQRHAEIIAENLGLGTNTKGVSTLGNKMFEECSYELTIEEQTLFRATAARALYLAQDRSDIGFATKAPRKSCVEIWLAPVAKAGPS